ncbi:MAG: tetratricopeptide repeat protein [Candidatus Hodarchaeota archaeon]
MEKVHLLFREGKYTEALQFLKSLLDESKDLKLQIQIQNEIGKTYLWLGQYKEAATSLQEAITRATEANHQAEIAYALNYLGLVYWQQGDNSQALASLQQSLAIRRDLPNEERVADTLNNLALVFSSIGDYDQALQLHQEQYEIDLQIGHGFGMSLSLNNIGNIHREKGDYTKAFECYHSAVEIDQQNNHKYGLARTYRDLGTIYRLRGDLEQAIKHCLQSVQLLEELEMRDTTYIRSLVELICAYIEANLFKDAKTILAKAELVSNALQSPLAKLLVQYSLGYLKQKELDLGEAINIYERCLSLAEEHNIFDYRLKCLLHLAEIKLLKYRDNFAEEDEEGMQHYLQAAHKLAVTKGIISAQVRLKLLTAMLYLAKMDHPNALKMFEAVQKAAQEKKFMREDQLAREHLNRVKKFLKQTKPPSQEEEEEFEEMMRYLREVQKLKMGN